MTVELLQRLSLAAYLAGGVFLGTAVLLFFLFHVPQIIGDLSGTSARRAIASIEQQNSSGSSPKSRRRRGGGETHAAGRFRPGRQRLPQNHGKQTAAVRESGAAPETTALGQNSGTLETTALGQNSGMAETTLLGHAAPHITVDVDFEFSESAETID